MNKSSKTNKSSKATELSQANNLSKKNVRNKKASATKTTSSKTTNQILITTNITYLTEESSALHGRFVWRYSIKVKNNTKAPVQLLNRHWKVYNEKGLIDEVFGPGVVGLQPVIIPEKEFSYESFCILDTPSGKMTGSYEMQIINNKAHLCKTFQAIIPDINLMAQGIANSNSNITYN